MTTPIDIRADHLRIVHDVLARHLPDGVKVWVFGSRATWATKDSSDLDLALEGDGEVPARSLSALEAAFEDSDLPYAVDVVDLRRIGERFRRIVAQQRVRLPGGASRSRLKETNDQPRNEWLESTVAEACSAIDYGLTASASNDSSGLRFLRITDIAAGRIDWRTVPYVAVDDDTAEKYRLHDGDIVLARTGASTGVSAYIKTPPHAVFASYLVRLRAKLGYDPRFLAYYLQSERFWQYIRGVLGDKSAQPNASASTMTAAPFRAPRDPAQQRAIAHVLGALDDKIELNRRMNATLGAMARALFRSWFVDFDPVRAKIDGRDTGLPKEVADLFPDRLVDSDGGEVPDGWPLESLAGHFEATKGVSYKGSGLGGDGVPLHNLNSVHEGGGYKYEGIKFYSGEYAERHRVRPGDVIVANTEQGHDRLLIGYAAIVPELFGPDGIASHHIYRLRPRSASWLSTRFLFFLLNSARMHDLVSGYANGTTVNMLPIDGVQRPPFVVPPRPLVEAYDIVVSCSERRREQASRESRILTDLREALLPKLVSGEMRVDRSKPALRGDKIPGTGRVPRSANAG